MPTIKGTFTVTMTPLEQQGKDGVNLGRMALEKKYRGELEGVSTGSMLTAMTPIEGSADYVAIEQFSGNLNGKKGSFVLTHHGRMHGDVSELNISVVPDSGTGALSGLRGTMEIDRTGDQHQYHFTFEA